MVQEYGVTYPKLLMFGEYGILLGGAALTIPVKRFSARFDFLDNTMDVEIAGKSNNVLKKYCEFLECNDFICGIIDIDGFHLDIKDGLFLSSDIPIGYGLGSSGVLCAAIYKTYQKKYSRIFELPEDLLFYKNLFSTMESFFHGKSSGLDPLACLVGKPLLIRDNEIFQLDTVSQIKGRWFLVDSGISRSTGKMVDNFLSKCYNSDFKKGFQSNYVTFVNLFINQVYAETKEKGSSSENQPVEYYMEAISSMQLKYFSEMIPDFLVPFWQQGLDSGCFYLKLLGAGGGGYYLGLSRVPSTTEEMVSAYGFKITWLDIF
jgi:mevalonate kinase